MAGRPIETILSEWRETERKLETVSDDVEWAGLTARITALRKEHQDALAARETVASTLRAGMQTPRPKT